MSDGYAASVPGYGVGSARNGLPPSRDYVYRGTGRDELTPAGVMMAWNRKVRAAGGTPRAANKADTDRLREVENELAAGTAIPQASPPARPAPDPARDLLAPLERDLAARGVIIPDKPVDYWPGPGVPGRCPDCGYLRTARGHKDVCGGES